MLFDHTPTDEGGLPLKEGQVVEVRTELIATATLQTVLDLLLSLFAAVLVLLDLHHCASNALLAFSGTWVVSTRTQVVAEDESGWWNGVVDGQEVRVHCVT